MKRTSLSERQLPSYTRGEEIFNMVSHIVGGALGIAYLVLCVIMAAVHKSAIGVVSSAIYGASVITLFTMSSVYHGVRPSMAKKVLQVIDHCKKILTTMEILGEEPSVTYAYYFQHIKPKPEASASPSGKTVWRCKICGYEYEGEEIPEDYICPICKHPASDFEKVL